jgi:ubiquinone/menaquinone biosynthesis C-methylase UbiE
MEIIFDKFCDSYDSWYFTPMGKFIDALETDCLFSLFKPEKNQKVLDVCCGTANFSIKLAKAGSQVTGIDISGKMLEIAKEEIDEEKLDIKLIEGDCSTISLEADYYDVIISMAGFEFIKNPISAYKNIMKYLKPGGFLFIGTIQKGSEWQKLYSSLKGTVYEYANFLSSDDLKNMDTVSFCDKQECLFIPPGLEEIEYNEKNEAKYKTQNTTGGFVCVKFKKNN